MNAMFRCDIEIQGIRLGSRAIAAVFMAAAILFILAPMASAQGNVNVTVSPGQVDRYEAFIVTVTTAYPNTTFSLSLSGQGYVLERDGMTNAIGIWEGHLSAAFDFGTYNVFVTAGNETAQATLTVGCSARCVVDLQNTWGKYSAELIAAGIAQMVIVVSIVLLIVEGPKTAHYFWKNGLQAVKRGQLTIGDLLKSPLAVFHGFVQPGRLSMKQDANDRIAVDLQRRALMEELHDASQAKFMEYDPDHMTALGEIFRDLQGAYDREGRMTTRVPPSVNKFERTGKDMADDIEMEEWMRQQKGTSPKGPASAGLQRIIDQHYDRRANRRWHVAIGLFLVIGLPCGLMAILGPLSYMGIYLEPVRPLWNPVFGDLGKFIIGLVGFLSTLVLVIVAGARHRSERARGRGSGVRDLDAGQAAANPAYPKFSRM